MRPLTALCLTLSLAGCLASGPEPAAPPPDLPPYPAACREGRAVPVAPGERLDAVALRLAAALADLGAQVTRCADWYDALGGGG